MNDNIKLLGTFIGGAAIGSLITFALVKEKYEALIDGEIEAMRIFYEDKYSDEERPKEEEEPEVVDDLREATSIKEGITIEMNDYTKYTERYKSDASEERPNEEDYHEEDNEMPPVLDEDYEMLDRPYVISFDEYTNSMTHIDKIELVYFKGDDVLVDDQDDIIDNVEYLIGEDNLFELGNEPETPNVLYVRNPKTGADYEIVQNHASFREVVLGDIPEDIEDDIFY